MRGRRVISLGGSNKRVLIPLLLGAQVTYRLAEATHSRFRAIDRHTTVRVWTSRLYWGWQFGRVVWALPRSPPFQEPYSSGKFLYIIIGFITFLCFRHIIPV